MPLSHALHRVSNTSPAGELHNLPGKRPRIVIVGAGFGGLFCARNLIHTHADVLLIDRQNHHLFQPLLYQVATGFLASTDVALPIRSVFRDAGNIEIAMMNVDGIDTVTHLVHAGNKTYPYDYLVLATGSSYNYFGKDEWIRYTLVLKTLDDALRIRQRILEAFEQAELETDMQSRAQLLTFVIIGAGPTGIEMAGALSELTAYVLKREYRHIRPEDVRIIVLEASARVLSSMPESASRYTHKILQKKGIRVHTGTKVEDIRDGIVITKDGPIYSRTIIWAAGVRPLPVASWLGVTANQHGAITVNEDLSVKGRHNIFVIGDAATFIQDGKPLPALGAVAKQQGEYLAWSLSQRVKGTYLYTPFRYRNLGTMATIGRNAAVAEFGRVTLKGMFTWILWSIVHVYLLTGTKNRMAVFSSWAWTYLTYGVGARIILRQETFSGSGNQSVAKAA